MSKPKTPRPKRRTKGQNRPGKRHAKPLTDFEIVLVDNHEDVRTTPAHKRRIALRIGGDDKDVVSLLVDSAQARAQQKKRWAEEFNLDPGAIEDKFRRLAITVTSELQARQCVAIDAQRKAAISATESEPIDDDDDEGEGKRGPSTSELLVRLALEHYRIGVDDHDEPFAVKREGPNVALMFRGSRDALRASLSRHYRQAHGKTPNASALADALTNLQGEALEAKPERTFLRVAKHCDGVVIDLGTADGRAIVVTPKDWRVVDKSPVLFRRTALTSALPVPNSGGELCTLTKLLNIRDASWPLVLGWLLAAFIPDISHPILMLGGEAGTGKTTFARMLIGLFDPSSAPTRSQPDDVERWVIAANGSWGVAIDNVSHIQEWWSDSLCKAVTDDGWVRRRLYTDGELSVISFRRVVILTSIDAGALRGDLGDRVLLCDLERIPNELRRAETELTASYESGRASIVGAILDLLAKVLAVLPAIELHTGPRMYDFARVIAAMDQVMGTNALETYVGQRDRIAEDVVDADQVGKAIVELLDARDPWTGTTGELLSAIAPDPDKRKWPKEWPQTPRGLTGRLARVAPALRALGIEIERPLRKPGGKRDRILTIRKSGDSSVPIVPSVPEPLGGSEYLNPEGRSGDAGNTTGDPTPPPQNGLFDPDDTDGNEGDDGDGRLHGHSDHTDGGFDRTEWARV